MRDAGCLVGGTDPRGGKQRGVCGPDRIGGGKSPERNSPKRILPREGIYGRYRTERIRIARASRPPSGGPSSSGPRPQAGALRSRQLQRPFPHSGLGHEMSFGNGKGNRSANEKRGRALQRKLSGSNASPRLRASDAMGGLFKAGLRDCLFVAVDDFSRELYVAAVPDKTAGSAARFPEQVSAECVYTIETDYTDNGKEFQGNPERHAFVELCLSMARAGSSCVLPLRKPMAKSDASYAP